VDWSFESLYAKARLYIRRAQDEPIDSALFGFWTSLSLELLCRAALAKIHPVLLADPTNEGNIQYAFGINPKSNPKSVQAKAVFARCSVFIDGFTDKMSAHCLIMADRRNAELHSGAAAFEVSDNSAWLPATYEVMAILLKNIGTDFADFLGEHAHTANRMLQKRRESIKKEVRDRISAARNFFAALTEPEKTTRTEQLRAPIAKWLKENSLRRECVCPACKSKGIMTGESLNRSPVRIDEEQGTITREVRVLPNTFKCPMCRLGLSGFQELNEAGLGAIYTVTVEEDPIEFFGIVPEEHVDVQELIRSYYEGDYQNE
jgi:rubredoxin